MSVIAVPSKPPLRQTRLQKQFPESKGLVLGLPFTEGPGAKTTHDFSGCGNDGTLNGGVTWQAGQGGWGLGFNGSTGYVSVASVPVSVAFTISAWVVPAVSPQVSFARVADTGFSNWWFLGTDGSGTGWQCYVNGSAGPSGGSVTAGIPTFLALTFDGATQRLYVNAVLLGATSATPPSPTTLPMTIGTQAQTTPQSFWQGQIDNVRLLNRSLSPDEIQQSYADQWRWCRSQPQRREKGRSPQVWPYLDSEMYAGFSGMGMGGM